MRPDDPRWKAAAVALEALPPDPRIVMHEHEGVEPRSYMAVQNLVAIMHATREIMALMNDQDELPAWCEQLLAEAKANVSKARDYVLGEKSG